MKINIFTYGFYPEHFILNELIEELSDHSEVTISTGLPNYGKKAFFEGYSILRGPYNQKYFNANIKRFPVVVRKTGLVSLALNYISNLFFGILNIVRLPKADVSFVFATSPIMTAIPAVMMKILFGTPVVIWLQDLWPESFIAITRKSEKHILVKCIEKLVKWIYKHTDQIYIQSEGFREHLNKYGYSNEITWIPNWFKPASVDEDPAWLSEIPEGKFVVTYAGNLGIAQKLDTLLEVAVMTEENENIFYAIVGDGSEKKRLLEKYGKLSNVHFYGSKPVQDMTTLFKKSSALVVLLKNDPVFALTIPSKIQSYMSAGKPILASLNGVGASLIKDYNLGLSSPSEDIGRLHENILELVSLDELEIQKIENNARNLFDEKFSYSTVVNTIIKKLLKYRK